jgi:hypothetical protein
MTMKYPFVEDTLGKKVSIGTGLSVDCLTCRRHVVLDFRAAKAIVDTVREYSRMELPCAGQQIPAYKSKFAEAFRPKMLRTFDTCHWPLRAVRTPRLFRAMARPRKLVMPDCWMEAMIGSTVWANLSASRIEILRPLAAASAVLVGLPSFIPVVLREARAALVLSEISRRSFSASAA